MAVVFENFAKCFAERAGAENCDIHKRILAYPLWCGKMDIMKGYVSVNHKFMKLTPKELLDLLDGRAGGLEVYVGEGFSTDPQYLEEIVGLLPKYDLDLRIHGDSHFSLEKQKQFLDKMVEYAGSLGEILVTLHPVRDDDAARSRQMTKEYLREIVRYVDGKNVTILLENLNDLGEIRRLKIDDVAPIIHEIPGLKMTYDIGHVIADGQKPIVSSELRPLIRNLHVHTYNEIEDHRPIRADDEHFDEIVRALRQFGDCDAVFEYNLYECRGETVREKVLDYLDSMELVLSAVAK